MKSEDEKKQELLQNVNKLTFSVMQQIKDAEDRLINKILKNLLKVDVEKKHLKKVIKNYDEENTNKYRLYYDKIYLGLIVFEIKEGTLDIEFKPFGRN